MSHALSQKNERKKIDQKKTNECTESKMNQMNQVSQVIGVLTT